ncbi:MAG: DNA cytosine methyltransferase [Candidatus Pacebacteria bacterium]|nr:DNA cytosine methyltransferase [Candidatus Paceibacterota bacterium]
MSRSSTPHRPHRAKSKALKPTAVDLFSGCGGLTLGLKKAGFHVVGAVDIEPRAVKTYGMNHPEVTLWKSDIKKLTARKILKELGLRKGGLDLLAGCPPCQGFSSMRTLNGKKAVRDERNDLIFEFLRLVKGLRPKAVMMENVPGLIDNRRMEEFKKGLHGLGYELGRSPTVLNTAHYGVPQRRRRMILMAGRGFSIPFAKPSRTPKTVEQTIRGLRPAGRSGDPLHDLPEAHTPDIEDRIASIPKDGGSRTDLCEERQLPCHRRFPGGFKDVYGRMRWKDVAPTITGGCASPSKGRFLHPEENRCITLREAALLQSFPKRYKFTLDGGKAAVALMIGNALPPEFIRRQAAQIKKELLHR